MSLLESFFKSLTDLLVACSFRDNIRNYNNAFAFSSLRVHIDSSVYESTDIFTFRIQGELYHHILSLLSKPDRSLSFSQIYIYDFNFRHQVRLKMNHQHDRLNEDIVLAL